MATEPAGDAATAAEQDQTGRPPTVEIRIAARAALIPTVRAVAADLAARADFDLDAIADLRMAVDEACAVLIDLATPDSTLTCVFTVLADGITAAVMVPAAGAPSSIPTDTFGWRVLQTLADHVEARYDPADAGSQGQAVITLHKRALTDPS